MASQGLGGRAPGNHFPGPLGLVRAVPGLSKGRSMSDNIVGDCTRCGQCVYEHQSHVMLANAEGERWFFHAGCESSNSQNRDLVEEKIGTANEA